LSEVWNALSAIGTLLSAVIILFTAIYAVRQVREARATRNINTVLSIHEQFSAPNINLIRRNLQEGKLGDLTKGLDPEVKRDLDDLLNQMQLLGVLVHFGFVDFEVVHELFPNIPVTWQAALPYIRSRQDLQPQYGRRIESLVKRYPSWSEISLSPSASGLRSIPQYRRQAHVWR
jgi:hypothetical protein